MSICVIEQTVNFISTVQRSL